MFQEATQSPTLDETATGIWHPRRRWLTIGLVLTISGAAFESLAVATILPAMVKDLGGLALYGWAFSAFMLANLIGITIAGAEADRRGPAQPFILGIVAFIIGLLVVGLAPSMIIVIIGRAIQGFGAGIISSVAYTAIGRGYAEAAKARMLAVLSSAWVIPGLIGPALAGAIADALNWRWVFLGLVPLIAIGAVMTLPALRTLAGGNQSPRNWHTLIAALRLALGATLVLGGLSQAMLWRAVPLVMLGVFLAGPALIQLLPPGTLRAAPGLPAAIATHGLLNLAFFGVDAFIPLALTNVRGQTLTMAGLALTAATIFWSTGSWVQAHLAGRQSRRKLELIGLFLILIGILGIASLLSNSVPVLVAPLAWSFGGMGMGLAFSTNSLVVLESAQPGQEGTASSAMQTANVLGTALGAGIGGVIIGNASETATVAPANILAHDVVMACIIIVAVCAATRLPTYISNTAAQNTPATHVG